MPPASDSELSPADLDRLIDVVNEISFPADPPVVAQRAAKAIKDIVGADIVGIATLEGARSIEMLGTAGDATDWFTDLSFTFDRGVGFTGFIMETGSPLVFNVLEDTNGLASFDRTSGAVTDSVLGPPYADHFRQRLSPERLTEYAGVPIELGDRILGVVYVGRRSGPMSAHGRALLVRFARMIAPVLLAARDARREAVLCVERDRQRIACELHDTVGQILFGIQATVGDIRKRHGSDGSLAAELDLVGREARNASAHLRAALRDLAPVRPEADLDYEARVVASMFTSRTGVPAEVVVNGAAPTPEQEVFDALVATIREGLHNVEKHAAATTAVVVIDGEPGRLSVIVQDDGAGVAPDFAIAPPGEAGHGFGLHALSTRLRRLGGQLTVSRNEDHGTTLKVTVGQ